MSESITLEKFVKNEGKLSNQELLAAGNYRLDRFFDDRGADCKGSEEELITIWEDTFIDVLGILGVLEAEKIDIPFPRDINGNLNVEYLKNIYKSYDHRAEITDELGNTYFKNPLPEFSFNSDKPLEEQMRSLGYQLGEKDDLGFCYYFMSDLDFATGYWISQLENSLVSDGTLSDKTINEIKGFYGENRVEASARIMVVTQSAFALWTPPEESPKQGTSLL